MALYSWSVTAATNATADATINWSEGQSPSSVNDSARAMMARIAEYVLDSSGSLTTGGTSTAYTVASNQVFDTLAHLNGRKLKLRFNAANGAAPTLNVDGLGAKALQSASGTAITSGMIAANSVWDVTYDNSIPAFLLTGVAAAVAAGSVVTGSIADKAVTYAKIQDVTNNRILANFSGGAAAPSEYSLTGATPSGSTIAIPFPPPAAFKNLSIKVASNTTVTVAADFVTSTDGTNFLTTALSGTINLGTNGAANALDAGSIAIDTWYAIWAIAKADGTTAGLASLSATAPTLPTGYTFKARIGWVRTIHASATLYGTWQFGRRAQYKVGLAQTSVLPSIAVGPTGTYSSSAPVFATPSVASLVPTTASEISILVGNAVNTGATANVVVAPTNSYAGITSQQPPAVNLLSATGASAMVNFILEATTVAWAADQNGGSLQCAGWVDNI